MLELERIDQLKRHIVKPGARETPDVLRFAGTVDHPRYLGRRRTALERTAASQSQFRIETVGPGMPAIEVWRLLQHCRGGIYLRGNGSLCFRLHEYAALGIPTIAADDSPLDLPTAWREVLPSDPASMCSPIDMLRFYRDCYHPCRAAEWLLTRCAAVAY